MTNVFTKKYYIKIGDNNFGPYDSINSWLFTSDKIIYTAKKIAEIKNISMDELMEITTANARRFFNI